MAQYSFASVRAGYDELWSRMKVIKITEADSQARKVINSKARYKTIERVTGVPWFVIGCLHMRESNGNFATYLGNGQPLNRRTTIVPKGRGPFATFEEGAYDALVTVERLNEIKDWGPAHVAYAAEKFNGFGYRHPARNIPSPYLWGGTSVQERGKFVRDGVYDPNTMDSQLGAMAVLKQIMALDKEARFSVIAVPPAKPAESQEDDGEEGDDQVEASPQQSPAAIDKESEVKPLAKSKTIWGTIWQFITTSGAAVAAFISGIPPWLVVVLVVAALIGLFLVVKGRIDVQKIVQHLSQDEAA